MCCSGVLGLEELFQALAGLPDGLGMVPAHVPVMPRLIDDAGDVLLLGGVTQDEPILPAVLHQPLLGGGAGLGLVQDLVTGVHQVHGQPQLVPGTATSVAACFCASVWERPWAIRLRTKVS